VDGISLDQFRSGREYVLGNSLGALFLAERWAEPIEDDEPTAAIPPTKYTDEKYSNEPRFTNLVSAVYPPIYSAPPALAVDRRGATRRRCDIRYRRGTAQTQFD